MAEQFTIGELLVRIKADVRQLDAGLTQAERGIAQTATRSRRHLGRLENAFRSLAVAGVGITGPLGTVSRALLAFAGGGFIATAVLAGLGAIILRFQHLKRAAEEARKAQDEFTRSLVGAGGLSLGQQQAAALARLNRLQGQLTGILGGRGVQLLTREEFLSPATSRRVKELQTEIRKLQQELMLLDRTAAAANREFQALTENAAQLAAQARGAFLLPEVSTAEGMRMAPIPGRARGIHPGMQELLGGQRGLMERLEGRIGQIAGRDLGSILASDENVQRILRAFEQQRQAFVMIGQTIGFALQDGIYSVLGGGNFFKGLFRTLLGIGIGAATAGIGGAITKHLTKSAGGIPAGAVTGTDLAMARNPGWQRFFRETQLVAASQGFRG